MTVKIIETFKLLLLVSVQFLLRDAL